MSWIDIHKAEGLGDLYEGLLEKMLSEKVRETEGNICYSST